MCSYMPAFVCAHVGILCDHVMCVLVCECFEQVCVHIQLCVVCFDWWLATGAYKVSLSVGC